MYARLAKFVVVGAGAVALTALGATSAMATFPGHNGPITFNAFSEATQTVHISSARANASWIQRLTESVTDHGAQISEWSPDGQTIAFDSNRVDIDAQEDVVQIYLMDADGSDVTQVTRGPGYHGNPGFSP